MTSIVIYGKIYLSDRGLLMKKIIFAVCAVLITAAIATGIYFAGADRYKIYDEENTVTVFSYSSDKDVILEKSGVKLGENDAFLPVEDGYRVLRAKNVTVLYGDTEKTFAIACDTVGEVLEKCGITFTEEDYCDIEDSAPVTDGMTVRMHKVTHDTTQVDTEIPFETVTKESIYVKKGKTKTTKKGEKGIQRVVRNNTYVDGVLTQSVVESDSVIKTPVNEVVEKGIGGTIGGYEFSYCKDMNSSAYTYFENKRNITATGVPAGYGKVAVDRKVIPLGTKMYITSANGKYVYGYAVAADTGVKGNTIDLFYETYEECINWGRRKIKVYILE